MGVMWQIGVWEQGEGLAERITALAEGHSAMVRSCSHPALLAGLELDLLVVSPGAMGWAGALVLSCRIALLPGGLSALTRSLPASSILSYGPSPRNTITLSGLNKGQAAVAVQREFLSLGGRSVDRQELVLPFDGTITEQGNHDELMARGGFYATLYNSQFS